jgi:hypothetical protein
MTFDVSPLTRSLGAASVDRPARAPGRTEESFADVTRSLATPPIPDEVWDQVDAASRLAENLHAQGRAVRFDVHKLDSDVVADLVDDEGGVVRPLDLGDVIDVDRLAYELAKEQQR